MRIVSLLPSATEIVFALGRGTDLVGVTFECDFPPAARTRRVVSTSALPQGLSPAQIDAVVAERVARGDDLYHLDDGALSELEADVVLTQDLCAVCAVDVDRVDDALAYLGSTARVVTLDPHTLDEVLASIVHVGAVLGAAGAANDLVKELRGRLDTLRAALADTEVRSVLVLEWTDPPFCAGHWVPDLVMAGGGTAVLAARGGESHRVDWNTVKSTPADVVLVAPCGYHLDPAAGCARQLAIDERLPPGAEVWAVDADSHFVRPGPRIIDGAEAVAQILHPEVLGAPTPDRARRVA